MRKTIFILLSMLMLLASACKEDVLPGSSLNDKDGMVRLNISATIPDMVKVNTRSIDSDGLGVQTLYLFNFNANGQFMGYTTAEISGSTEQWLNFTADVPSLTRIVHLVANQNLVENFDASIGDSEENVMRPLEATSGRLRYWARVESANIEDLQSKVSQVKLLRNQAKVSVNADGVYDPSQIRFVVCNTYMSGTTVPFNADAADGNYFEISAENPFITLPLDKKKISHPNEITTESEQYIFENENREDDQIYVILQVMTTGKYYKVMLCDDNKEPFKIYRNHHYRINITAELSDSKGVDNFVDAIDAAPYNNASLYVSDGINQVYSGNKMLKVEETAVIYHTSSNYNIKYVYTENGVGSSTVTPEITWLPEEGDFGSIQDKTYNTNGNGEGNIRLYLPEPTEDMVRRGTLLVKAGGLSRRIKVYLCPKFKFEPVWISTGVPREKDQNVIVMFTIPETFPEELLPFKCRITNNLLDANGITPLDVNSDIIKGDEIPNDCNNYGLGYSYEYLVESKGVQRAYFWTRSIPEDTEDTYICVSSEHFEHLERRLYFTDGIDMGNKIIINTDGDERSAYQYTIQGATGSEDRYEAINYWLLPRKKDQEYVLNFSLDPYPEEDITLRIYTEHMNPKGNGWGSAQIDESSGGRYFTYTALSNSTGKYSVTFIAPVNCEEVLRISCNDPDKLLYRSVPVEIANFRAFEFNPADADLYTDEELVSIDDRNRVRKAVDYGPGREVVLKFNVSPFNSEQVLPDGTRQNLEVNPGGDFDVFIKTQTLVPDDGTQVEKVEDGIYKYHISSEGSGGTIENPAGGNIYLNFHTRDNYAVNEETVTIYTDMTEIDYTPLEFVLNNNSMTGSITYGASDLKVPVDAFLTIERRDGTRVGRFTMTDEGEYSIKLYGEYNLRWDEQLTVIYNNATDGVLYQDSGALKDLLSISGIHLQSQASMK